MQEVSNVRLWALKAMYLFIAVGLSTFVWQEVFAESGNSADAFTVINAFMLTMILLALVGLCHPLKMLPILFFELLWKTIWLLVFALPMHLNQGLDEYAAGVAFACAIGVVLTPLVIPWKYVVGQFVLTKK